MKNLIAIPSNEYRKLFALLELIKNGSAINTAIAINKSPSFGLRFPILIIFIFAMT
jgi:hypothetical protein